MKPKGQHFLLSAAAREMSLVDILRMSDEDAFNLFKLSRWPETNGNPVCPRCGCHAHYWIGSRRQWRCKECAYTFSVTAGTIFASHKKPLRIYIAAVALYSNTAKGFAALQLSRDLDVQYKTAFVLMHKIRESLIENRDESPLSGEVEMDGAYACGHVRPKNKKEDRIDRRLAENQNPNKRCILVMRQRGEEGAGALRTLTYVTKSENQDTVAALSKTFIKNGTVIHADENSAYDALHAAFETRRVNHNLMCRGENGECTNNAESYFSRFRRMQIGQVHKITPRYLDNYAHEVAYREDTRRWSNGAIFQDVVGKCASSRVSRDFCGYWQKNKRTEERLV